MKTEHQEVISILPTHRTERVKHTSEPEAQGADQEVQILDLGALLSTSLPKIEKEKLSRSESCI